MTNPNETNKASLVNNRQEEDQPASKKNSNDAKTAVNMRKCTSYLSLIIITSDNVSHSPKSRYKNCRRWMTGTNEFWSAPV